MGYPLNHICKAYGECQGRYNGYHSVSIELLRLHIPHIGKDDAQNGQENDSDSKTGYEYQQHPEDDAGCRRVRNKAADISDLVTKADHVRIEINERLKPVCDELYGTFH